jgi:ABC-type transport system involved in multi-copper enzyme maturation permease subunit
MKALAIFKDSLREAIDGKVLYVMVGLSALLTLVTATLTFKPEPPGQAVKSVLLLSLVSDTTDIHPENLMGMAFSGMLGRYEIKDMKPRDGAPEGPRSPYTITLAVHCKGPEEATELRAQPAATEQLIRDRFGKLDDMWMLDISDVRLAPSSGDGAANDVYFEIAAQPTATAARLWPHEPSLMFGALPLSFLGMNDVPLGMQLWLLEDKVVGGIGAWVAILASVIITAFFVPNMLRKGTVDLLLVKPIHRSTLLLYKYLGGLTFILLNTAVAVFGVWLALGWRSGIWAPSFLLMIPVIGFFFAILYAASTLFGVLTRSSIAAILLTCAVWFGLFVVGLTYQIVEEGRARDERRNVPASERSSDNWFAQTVRGVHYVLPRTRDLDYLTSMLLVQDLLTANQVKSMRKDQMRTDWGESLTVSGIFIVLCLGLSCWWFATRDY